MKLSLSLLWRVLVLHFVYMLLVVVPFRDNPFMAGELYMQWKPTILWWGLGLVLLGSHFVTKQGLLYFLWGSRLKKTEVFWKRLNIGLVVLYLVLGLLSILVATLVAVDTWLKFKLVVPLLLLVLFVSLAPRFLEHKQNAI